MYVLIKSVYCTEKSVGENCMMYLGEYFVKQFLHLKIMYFITSVVQNKSKLMLLTKYYFGFKLIFLSSRDESSICVRKGMILVSIKGSHFVFLIINIFLKRHAFFLYKSFYWCKKLVYHNRIPRDMMLNFNAKNRPTLVCSVHVGQYKNRFYS